MVACGAGTPVAVALAPATIGVTRTCLIAPFPVCVPLLKSITDTDWEKREWAAITL